MTPRERVALAPQTTFGLGGAARFFVEVKSEEELKDAAAIISNRAGRGFFILGGGSNVLAPAGELDALVIKISILGAAFEDAGDRVRATISAGESWDAFVREAAARSLWGVENLAGIPGSAGGAAVQNIGAYGAELADVLEYADVVDLATGESRRLAPRALSFGYRDSIFKKQPMLAITRIALALSRTAAPNLSYADLTRAKERGVPLSNPREIGEGVRQIRAGKFPDLAQEGTAGSFFKNPVVARSLADSLAQKFPDLPRFPQSDGRVKLSLAWLLDHGLSLKGFSEGGARLFEKQPLVIVATHGARVEEVEALAREVERRVRENLGIELEREVIHMQPHFSSQIPTRAQ